MIKKFGRLMLDINGTFLSDEDKLLIENKHVGGLILFSRNFQSFQQIKGLIAEIKNIKDNIIIAVDQEGGRVQRFNKEFSKIPSMQKISNYAKANDDDLFLKEVGWLISSELIASGVDINFAPVLDIDEDTSSVIGDRAFANNVSEVIKMTSNFIDGMHEAGMSSTGKHFPGHGDTSQDSHKVLPKIKFSKARIDSIELFPYRELIKKGLSSVMIAHLNIPSYDKNIPSSMSENIVTDLLKNKLNFNGLIITDALDMKGATSLSKNINLDLQALIAGNDILLMSNDVSMGIKEIKKAYMSNIISEERLSYSVKKILKAKFKAGLNETKEIKKDNILKDLNSDKDRKLYSKAVTRAITVLKNNNDLIPLYKNKKYGLITLGDSNHNYFYNELSKNIDLVKFNLDTSIEDISKKIDSSSSFAVLRSSLITQ